MRTSLAGNTLPESRDEFIQLKEGGKLRFENCWRCKQPHDTSQRNTRPWDWSETQISGTCGQCWTELFKTPTVAQ